MSVAVLLCLAAAAAAAQPECAGVGSVRGDADLQPRCTADGRTFQRTPATLLPDDHRFVGMEAVQRLRRDVRRLSRRRQRTRKRRWVPTGVSIGAVACPGGACDPSANQQCCQPSTEVVVPLSATSSVTEQRVQIVQSPPQRLQPVLVGRCPGLRCPLTNITCQQLYAPQMMIKLSGQQLHLDLVYVESGCRCLPEATGLPANHTGSLPDTGSSGHGERSSSSAAPDRLKYVLEDQLLTDGIAAPADDSQGGSAETQTLSRSQSRDNTGDWELEAGNDNDDVGEDERDRRQNDTVVLVHTAGDDWEFVIQRLHGEESEQGRSSSESTKEPVQTQVTAEMTAKLQPVSEDNADSSSTFPSVPPTLLTPDVMNTAHTGQSQTNAGPYTTSQVITTSQAIPQTKATGSGPLSHPTHPVTSLKTSLSSMSTAGTRTTSASIFEGALYDKTLIPGSNTATIDPTAITGTEVFPEESASGVNDMKLHISQEVASSVSPTSEGEVSELLRTYAETEPPQAEVTVALQKMTGTVDIFSVSETARGVEKLTTDLPIANISLEREVPLPYTDEPSQLEVENQLRPVNVSVLENQNGPGAQAIGTSEPSNETGLSGTVAKKPKYGSSVRETTAADDISVKPDFSVLSPEPTKTAVTPSVAGAGSVSEDGSYDEAETSMRTTASVNLMALAPSGSASEGQSTSSGTVVIPALEREESSTKTLSDTERSITPTVESGYEVSDEKTGNGNAPARPTLPAGSNTVDYWLGDKQPQRGDIAPLPRPTTTVSAATTCITMAATPTPAPSPPLDSIVSTRSKQKQHSHNLTQALEFLSQTIANVRRQEVEALSDYLSPDHWRLVRLVASSYALGSEACRWTRSEAAPLPTTTQLPTTTRAAVTADAPLQSAVSLIVEAMERERRALEKMYDRRLEALDKLISEKQQAVRSTFERELQLLKSILQSLGLPERQTTEVDAAAEVDADSVTCGDAPLATCGDSTEPAAQENVASGSGTLTPDIQNDASQVFSVVRAAPGLECGLVEEENAEEKIIEQLDGFTSVIFDIGLEFYNAFRPEQPGQRSMRMALIRPRTASPSEKLIRLLRQIAGSYGRFSFAFEDAVSHIENLEKITTLLAGGIGLEAQSDPVPSLYGLPEAIANLLRCFIRDLEGFRLAAAVMDNFETTVLEPMQELSGPGTGELTQALTVRLTALYSRVWSVWRFLFNSLVRPATSVELRVEENLRVVHLNREELRLLVDGAVSALLPEERAQLASAQQALASAAEPLQFAVSELRELARLLVNAAELLLTSDAGARQRRQAAQVGPPAVVRQMAAAVLDGLDCFVGALADPAAASAEFDAAVRPTPSADAAETASTPALEDQQPPTALATVFPPECELIEEQNAEEQIIAQLDGFTELLFDIGVEFFNAFRPEEPLSRRSLRVASLQSRASLTPRTRLFRLLRQIAGSVGRFQFALEDVEAQLDDLEQVFLLLGSGLGLPPQPGQAVTAEGLPEAMAALLRCFLDGVRGFLLADMVVDNFNASLIEPLAQLSSPGTGGVTRALTIRLTSLFSRVWSVWRFLFNSLVRPATSVELRVEENLRVVHLNREELRLLVDGAVSALLPEERAQLASAQQALASAAEPLQFAVSELRELARLLVNAAELLLTSDAGARQRRQAAQVGPPAVVRQMAAAVLDGLDCFVGALADPAAASAEFDAAVRPAPSADAAETDTTEPALLVTSTGLAQGATSRQTTPEIIDTSLTTSGGTATDSPETLGPTQSTALPTQSSATTAKSTLAFDTSFQSLSDITAPEEVASVKMTSASPVTATASQEQTDSSEKDPASYGFPTISSEEASPPESEKTRSTREIDVSTGSSSILTSTMSSQGVTTGFQSISPVTTTTSLEQPESSEKDPTSSGQPTISSEKASQPESEKTRSTREIDVSTGSSSILAGTISSQGVPTVFQSTSPVTATTSLEQPESSEKDPVSSGQPTISSEEASQPESERTKATREMDVSTGSSSILAGTISSQGVPTFSQSTLPSEGSDVSSDAEISSSSVSTFSTSQSGTSAASMMTENGITEASPQQETPVSSSMGPTDLSTGTAMPAEASETSSLLPDTTLFSPGGPGDASTSETLSSAPETGTTGNEPTVTPVTSQQEPTVPPAAPFLSEEDAEMIEELLAR